MNESLNELALFAGAGGGILGGILCGFRTVCAVEHDPYARDVLVARQNDGCLAPFPVWDDVCTFDGRSWRGRVDVVSGGFPCQDISAAGKGAGIDGERSGLWGEMARIIGEVRPRLVLVENSPMLTSRGLGRVLGDLAKMGYDAEWGVLGAVHAGAPHKRERIWIVAHRQEHGWGTWRTGRPNPSGARKRELAFPFVADASRNEQGRQEQRPERKRVGQSGESIALGDADGVSWGGGAGRQNGPEAGDSSWWFAEPDVGRVAHGVAARVDRLRCLGNGQVPEVVRLARHLLQPRDLPK
jgi:DNA (cytosine-5)-methyltransferase 1